MTIVHLIRPALLPERDLELRMRESGAGLSDFVQAMSPPSRWLEIEILEADMDVAQPHDIKEIPRR